MRGFTNAAPASGLKVIAEGSGSTYGSAQVDLPSPAKLAVVMTSMSGGGATSGSLVIPGVTVTAGLLNSISLSSDGESLSIEYGGTTSGSLRYEYLALG